MRDNKDLYIGKDIDWFFVANGHLCHVASAGGRIPSTLSEVDVASFFWAVWGYFDNLEELAQKEIDFFLDNNDGHLVRINGKYIYQRFVGNSSISESEVREDILNYLKPFVKMALRGCFSFDRTGIWDFDAPVYHLIAWPTNPIKLPIVDLPESRLDKLKGGDGIRLVEEINRET